MTHRICFNRGDHHFAKADHVVKYENGVTEWQSWLEAYLIDQHIDAVCCYGDCRRYHAQAKSVCDRMGVRFIALEEGYVRPGFVTLERDGNNANSSFPEHFKAGRTENNQPIAPAQIAGHFRFQCWFAFLYYVVKDWRLVGYRNYAHHRSGNGLLEMLAWLRGFSRKHMITRWRERGLARRLISAHGGKMFLVPLQVAADMQIICHSNYDNVRQFIEQTIRSFAENAAKDAHLVIKHHPMDRGFQHYGGHVRRLSKATDCSARVTYVFDLNLDKVFEHTAGCITINSTVGLQALERGVPTITLGNSMVRMAGIAPAENLEAFWTKPGEVNKNEIADYRERLIAATQVPGSFYRDRQVAAMGCARKIVQIVS